MSLCTKTFAYMHFILSNVGVCLRGTRSWGWMEPVLGQVSFFLLCMQFARSQLHNLGIRPYFHWQAERRANRLVQKYPQYDAEFLRNYSRNDRLMEPHDMAE